MKPKDLLLFITMLFVTTTLAAQNRYDIRKALQIAKANNRNLKTEGMSISVSESDIITAKLRPNLSLSNQTIAFAETKDFAPNTNITNSQNRQVQWVLSKKFQLPSQRKYKIDLAHKNVSVAQANYFDFERNLLTEVAINWLEVWLSQKKWETALLAKNNWDTLVVINKNRLKNQIITTTDYSRAVLAASQYELLAQTAKRDFLNKTNSLKFILGVDEDIIIDTDDNIESNTPDSEKQIITKAIENRSDIRLYKSNIEAMKSNISLQKSLAYPQPEFGFMYNPQNAIPYIGISAAIDLPFFDRNQGEIKKSEVLKDKTEQELLASKEKIKTEVTNAYTGYKQFEQNVTHLKSMKEQSLVILENVKYSYMRGGTTLIDYLEAQRTWYESQQNYYEAVYQHKESYINLLYTTGLINQIVP